jgi:hypothetical protein
VTRQHSKPYRLASAALLAAIDEKFPAAARLVQRLYGECGPDSVVDAILAWCDTLHAHATDGDMAPLKIRIGHMTLETGEVDKDVPPRIAIAGRLIAARIADDEPGFRAICDEVSSDKEWSQVVCGVLEQAAATIRTFPRGYARMGGAR